VIAGAVPPVEDAATHFHRNKSRMAKKRRATGRVEKCQERRRLRAWRERGGGNIANAMQVRVIMVYFTLEPLPLIHEIKQMDDPAFQFAWAILPFPHK
jgi:hypothetical protein